MNDDDKTRDQLLAELRALRPDAALFRALFDNALDGIILTDDEGRYVDANPAALRIIGYTHDEVVRMTVWDVTPGVRHDEIRGMIQQFLDAGTMSGEFPVVCKDGSARQLEYRSVTNIRPGLHLSIHRDVTDRRRDEEALAAYSRRLVEVQEEERRRLARELHDEIGQVLTGLKFALGAGEQAGELIADALGRVRRLASDLRPAQLDHLGLVPALREMFRHSPVRVNFHQAGLERRFAPALETAAYRIVQEALTNVARHAGAAEAAVRLRLADEVIEIQVEDEGKGFDPDATPAGSCGLIGMRERAASLGGRLAVESQPGGGTCLIAELPLGGGGER